MSISSPFPPHHHHPLLPLLEKHNTNTLHIKQIHAHALRTSPSLTPQENNALLFLYSRLVHHSSSANSDDLSYACKLLDHRLAPSQPAPNSFCFNSLIRASSRRRRSLLLDDDKRSRRLPLRLYRRMLLSGTDPDNHTFPFVLRACAFLFDYSFGCQVHSYVIKLGFFSDVYVCNSLIHFYSSCGELALARCVFDRMPTRNQVSWNAVIDAHSSAGEYEVALGLFRSAMREGVEPDGYAMQSVLRACAGLGCLSLGLWAHAFMMNRSGGGKDVLDDVLINNSLLDLYSKCGAIRMARQVFHRMPARDVPSWNSMILCATHGRVRESLDLFEDLCAADGLRPNSITFVAVLSACKHGGLVNEGRRYFGLMTNELGLEPELEHFGCMVDLLARAGFISEALDVVNEMNCKPDAVIWRCILDACCKKNVGIDLSSSVAQKAIEAGDEHANSGTYVLLSKVYALANRWDDVGSVRKIMSERGIRKEPGCSSIEIDGLVHEFVAGDTSHPRSDEIYAKMGEVEDKLASAGYRPDSSQAPMVAGVEGVKSGSLKFHSERIAIAFGLLNAKKGMPIRILKNLRVCGDCHTMTKLISRAYDVEIVVRDRTRFHHFKDGSCSCMDYW